ncbi:mannose-P-dolichol utilization defect 1 protein homolog [Limulus polyphemus]|uniref:Mannose-P-dolichol utilization defect 1 protein homolog n=1 Tax=Limulus polyphemus TaxID=6850 RepID=A0ABM1AZG8_LIMPO|nr:mannose-P-dolichol utilization defect 1 protein homolog [Limulus polyphemus]
MDIFRKSVLQFLPQQCFDEFFVDFNFFHAFCLKLAITKGLGIGIILGSVLVKVPQIVKILKAKSAEGINLFGVLLELMGVAASAAYCLANGYPFSSWGETFFLVIETAAIAFLILFYNQKKEGAYSFLIVFTTLCYILGSGFTPINILSFLQLASVPVVISGKLVQVVENYKNGHTGQLSAITVSLLFLGSSARIFTSIQETGDWLIIFNYISAAVVNFFLVFQMVLYWNVVPQKLKKSD